MMEERERISGTRIFLLMMSVALVFTVLVMRLYYLQVIRADQLKDRSKLQRTYYLALPPTRGMIMDRKGNPLAVNVKSTGKYIAMLDKSRIENVSETVRKTASLLDVTESEVKRHIAALLQPEVKARDIQHDLSETKKDQLIEADIEGLFLRDQAGRFYPEGPLAANVIGFTGKDNKGWAGLEFALNDKLEVAERVILAEKDRARRLLATEDLTPYMNQRVDVVLTIDSYIQYVVERELKTMWEECEAEDANAVVLHAQTGEILAMANVPTFDPNQYQDYPAEDRKNRLLGETFEPGSILKPFTLIAALDKQTITPDTIFDCEDGSYYFAGKTIHDDIHRFGKLTVRDILIRSSNIGTVKIAQSLSENPDDFRTQAAYLYEYLKRFGFKDEEARDPNTTILPYEHVGILRPPYKWYKSDIGAVPFGQAIATNTLILAGAYNAIANRGLYQSPYLIKGYRDVDGIFYPREYAPPTRIVSREVVEQVVEMMVGVTENPEGTGTRVRIPGFHIAGKTGTAQKAENGVYVRGKRVASFAGFFPAKNPEVVIVVVVDEPKNKKYGGEVAGPVWKAIAEEIIAYRGISPTYKNDPLLASASQNRSVQETNRNDVPHQMFGVSKMMPIPMHRDSSAAIDTMPDLVGQTIREAYVELVKRNVYAKFTGAGKVVKQQTKQGTPLQGKQSVGVIECNPMLTDFGVPEVLPLIAKN